MHIVPFKKKDQFKNIQIKNKTIFSGDGLPPNSRTMKAKKIYNIECNSKISCILLKNPAAFYYCVGTLILSQNIKLYGMCCKTTKLILLDSLLQEVVATLPHLVLQKPRTAKMQEAPTGAGTPDKY